MTWSSQSFLLKKTKINPNVLNITTTKGLRTPELRHNIIQNLSEEFVLSNNCCFIHTFSCPPTFCFWPHPTVELFGDIRLGSWYFLCSSFFLALKMTAIIVKIRNRIMYKSVKEIIIIRSLSTVSCSYKTLTNIKSFVNCQQMVQFSRYLNVF